MPLASGSRLGSYEILAPLGAAGELDGKPRAITPEGVSAFFRTVSPDGKSIAAVGPDHRVAIYPADPGEPRPVPGLATEDVPIAWTAEGRSLYVFRPSAQPGRVDAVEITTGRRTTFKEFRPPTRRVFSRSVRW